MADDRRVALCVATFYEELADKLGMGSSVEVRVVRRLRRPLQPARRLRHLLLTPQ